MRITDLAIKLRISVMVLVVLVFAHAQSGAHWLTDELGGVAVGALVVMVLRRLLERDESHATCRRCPWVQRTRRESVSNMGSVGATR